MAFFRGVGGATLACWGRSLLTAAGVGSLHSWRLIPWLSMLCESCTFKGWSSLVLGHEGHVPRSRASAKRADAVNTEEGTERAPGKQVCRANGGPCEEISQICVAGWWYCWIGVRLGTRSRLARTGVLSLSFCYYLPHSLKGRTYLKMVKRWLGLRLLPSNFGTLLEFGEPLWSLP